MPINEASKNLVLRDNFIDIDLPAEFVNKPQDQSTSVLYLASAAVSPEFRTDMRLKGATYNLLYHKLIRLAERGVRFKELCGDVVSEDGFRFASRIGMKFEVPRTKGFGVYSVKLVPFSLSGRGTLFEELSHLYSSGDLL